MVSVVGAAAEVMVIAEEVDLDSVVVKGEVDPVVPAMEVETAEAIVREDTVVIAAMAAANVATEVEKEEATGVAAEVVTAEAEAVKTTATAIEKALDEIEPRLLWSPT
jgi:hypothetical protein